MNAIIIVVVHSTLLHISVDFVIKAYICICLEERRRLFHCL